MTASHLRRQSVAFLAVLSLSSNMTSAQTKSDNIAVAGPNHNHYPSLTKLTPIADKPQPAPEAKPKAAPAPKVEKPEEKPEKDQYPTLARMENITFGHANAGLSLETRLNYLEATIFRQSFSHLSPNQRSAKLQETLFGAVEDTHFPSNQPVTKATPPQHAKPAKETHETPIEPAQSNHTTIHAKQHHSENDVVRTEKAAIETQEPESQSVESQPYYQSAITPDELKIFVLQMVNDRRQLQGLPTLTADEAGDKVAHAHAADMASRSAVSHFDATGENPDQRYTKAGGTDSVTECLAMKADHGKLNRMVGMFFLRDLLAKQDDRDAIMSPDATSLGFAASENHNHTKAFGCFEIVSKHGLMQPVPTEVKVGDKIEVKGAIFEPYRIDRVTLAWEKPNPEALIGADETDEALPYFPPLDFVAYAGKSEKDWSTGINMLKAAGIVACFAGGMFIPPVALGGAALSMMPSGNPYAEPKPASDIPVKGGIKTTGGLFNVKVAISNDDKPGLYYLTVWAMAPGASKAIPISRRIIVADKASHEKDSHKEEKHDNEK